MSKKNLIYFGSPEFSAQILKSLMDIPCLNVVGVVTQPDKPVGRKKVLTPSQVAQEAANFDLPVFKPNILDQANLAHLKLLKPDIFLVVSYGKIIPSTWLNLPKLGTFNIHFSLLPKYRGALCISQAIRNMDPKTGVTLMKMDEQLDHGPIVSQSEVSIKNTDDVATLTTKLTQAAMQLLANKLPEICAGKFKTIPQEESQATYTPKTSFLTRENTYIPFEKIMLACRGEQAAELSALIRSLTPEPGAWTKINGNEIKLMETHIEKGLLEIDTVQLSGRSPISWKQFLAGHPEAEINSELS